MEKGVSLLLDIMPDPPSLYHSGIPTVRRLPVSLHHRLNHWQGKKCPSAVIHGQQMGGMRRRDQNFPKPPRQRRHCVGTSWFHIPLILPPPPWACCGATTSFNRARVTSSDRRANDHEKRPVIFTDPSARDGMARTPAACGARL